MLIRLNKHLASLGVASRRKVDRLIAQGQIKVNGITVTLGQKINPDHDKITINSKPVTDFKPTYTYLILNKPKNVLTTTRDDRGRTTVLDFIKTNTRLFPVGRLDYLSTGLVLLTNDGTLTNLITHPKYHLPKTYLVTTNSPISAKTLKKLATDIKLDNQKLIPSLVSIHSQIKNQTTLKITLFQGKKRQIRRMFESLGLNLLSLHRIAIGPINIGKLSPGSYRPLTKSEVGALKQSLN